MSESKTIDGAYLSPKQKRAEVERGNTVLYPWAGNQKSLQFNASDIMLGSSRRYKAELELHPDWATDPDAVHKAKLIPT